ncbi:MAG: hypothetical protein WBL27_10660 [Salinimicrobium sp.]
MKTLRKIFFVFLFLNLMLSCRLGEVMSEADPETNAEYEPGEEVDTIVPRKNQREEELK